MTEQEFKLKQKVDILEIELKDLKKSNQYYWDNCRELTKVVGRIAFHLDVLDKDRGVWSMCKDNIDNVIYNALGITDVSFNPFLVKKL